MNRDKNGEKKTNNMKKQVRSDRYIDMAIHGWNYTGAAIVQMFFYFFFIFPANLTIEAIKGKGLVAVVVFALFSSFKSHICL